MKRFAKSAVLLFLAALVALAVVASRAGWGRAPEPEPPTVRVRRGTLAETVVAIGTIKPQVGAEVRVGSRRSGLVTGLAVGVGDQVARGDLLATLDDQDVRARLAMLRAEMDAAVAELEYGALELERTERLADLVAQLDTERARSGLKVRRAAVARLRAAIAEAELGVGDSVLRAPMAGTVASVSTSVGETVAASFASPTFVTILDLRRLEVQAYVDETDIGRVDEGKAVTLRVDAFPGQPVDGTVRAIYPKAQLVDNVVQYVVIIDLASSQDLPLRPEMTVQVQFVLASREGALTVPRSALFQREGESYLVVREAGGWQERTVRTGLHTPQRVEIIAGVEEGDTVVADRQNWTASQEGEPG